MKLIFSLLLIILTSSVKYSQQIDVKPKESEKINISQKKINHFRDTDFGLSKKEIKKIETTNFLKEENYDGHEVLMYEGIVAGLETNIWYIFINDELVSGVYYFNEDHTNDNLYIDDYLNVKNLNSDKYGKPIDEKLDWSDKLYRDDPNRYVFAVSLGHLTYISTWKFENGYIINKLGGDNYDIIHSVHYRLNKFDEYIRIKKKSSSDF